MLPTRNARHRRQQHPLALHVHFSYLPSRRVERKLFKRSRLDRARRGVGIDEKGRRRREPRRAVRRRSPEVSADESVARDR